MKRLILFAMAVICSLWFFGCSRDIQSAGVSAEEAFDIAVSWANWTDDGKICSDALNTEKMTESSILHLPIYRFDTAEDLEQFRTDFANLLSMDTGYDEIPSFNDIAAKYDETFFAENSLMLVYVSANSGSYRYGVDTVFCNGDSFYIHIKQLNSPEVVTCDMAGWFVTVAVSDRMIEDCTEFDADLNNPDA